MLRASLVLIAVLTALAVTAAPADASRSYGAFNPFSDLLTFELDASGRRIERATLRAVLNCGNDTSIELASTFAIVRRRPSSAVRNRGFLIRRPSRRGSVRYDVWSALGDRREYDTFTGQLVVSRIRARSARVQLTLRSRASYDRSRCRRALTLRGEREPGVLYVGETDDDEPVWARRQAGPSVEWLSGFGTACEPRGFMQGIHMNVASMNDATTFGWSEPKTPACVHGPRARREGTTLSTGIDDQMAAVAGDKTFGFGLGALLEGLTPTESPE